MITHTIDRRDDKDHRRYFEISTTTTVHGLKYQIHRVFNVFSSRTDFKTLMSELPTDCILSFNKSGFSNDEWNYILNLNGKIYNG